MDPAKKEKLLVEVVERVLNRWAKDPANCEQAIFDTIYEERRRLEKESKKRLARKELRFYNNIYSKVLKGSPHEHRILLKQCIQRFADEIVGHFDPIVHAFAPRIVLPSLNILFNSGGPWRLIETFQGSRTLIDQLEVNGETRTLKKVSKLGPPF